MRRTELSVAGMLAGFILYDSGLIPARLPFDSRLIEEVFQTIFKL
jgi:hypothetical protein